MEKESLRGGKGGLKVRSQRYQLVITNLYVRTLWRSLGVNNSVVIVQETTPFYFPCRMLVLALVH